MGNSRPDQRLRRVRFVSARHHHHRCSPQSKAIGAICRLFVKNAVRMWSLQPNLHWPFNSIDQVAEQMNCTSNTFQRRGIAFDHRTIGEQAAFGN